MIAKIAVSAANFAIDKPYSYAFSPEQGLKPGVRVTVPFGRGNRPAEGVVLSVAAGDETGLKSVAGVLDTAPVLSDTMLRLAAFLRDRCYCSFYDVIRAMLPAGLWFDTKKTFTLIDESYKSTSVRQPDAVKLLQLFADCGGTADEELLRTVVSDEEALQKAIRYLMGKKWITAHQDYSRKANDKTEQIATLTASAEEAMEFAQSRPRSAAAQKSVLQLLCGIGSASVKEICYFTGAKPATVRRLAELGYLSLSQREVLRCRQIRPDPVTGPLELNEQQQEAFEGLSRQLAQEAPGAALLYGVTGSGKTAVYIRLIRQCLENGRQAMLLVPEIALTPQLLGQMAAWFGDRVAVLHSSLPVGERYDQWKRIRAGQAQVVIGTRSAVFAPCPDLGLIILDEEQEHSYKSENNPRYDAKEVALWRGVKEKALVLFGSATPTVETMYRAKSGDYCLYTLEHRWGEKPLPQVQIVDMRQEVKLGNDLSLSYPLLDAIRQTADSGSQTILFLNRRGNSRALVCIDCGEAPECPRCNARLTYHSANERLMCHHCGYSIPSGHRCSRCGGPVKRVGTGTQRIQQELEQVCPDLKTERMDTDTVNAANTHEVILERFRKENIPVLVGTQMVAKGLNLKNVTLVGVLDADLGLYSDSYRAHETTFNMLTQVVGRAGRGEAEGRAMIQTMVPQHQVITLAANQDYQSFYDLEIGIRRTLNLPPFADMTVITFSGPDEARVLHGATKFRDSLHAALGTQAYFQESFSLLGPAPCPVPKINYSFRYRLTLRCRLDKPLRLLLGHLLRQFSQDKDNKTVSAFIDVNGYE